MGNTASGQRSLYANTSGSRNTASGPYALHFNTTGNENVAFGGNSLKGNTTGTHNTACGYNAFLGGSNYNNSAAFGYNASISGSNQIHLGNSSITEIKGQVAFTTYSDGRIKNNIQENVAGLEFINQLRPVTYNFDIDKQNELLGVIDLSDYNGKYNLEKIQFSGFIAQEVEQAANATGYNFSGIKIPKNTNELYGLSYAEFVVPLVKSVQELSENQEELTRIIHEQQEIINQQQKLLEELQAKLNAP
jgi:hypothetical protein